VSVERTLPLPAQGEQAPLFDVPAAYVPSLWTFVPNAQDTCLVDLDAVVALARRDEQ
jgi:hypothetical protein